jgi:hypothetical protein
LSAGAPVGSAASADKTIGAPPQVSSTGSDGARITTTSVVQTVLRSLVPGFSSTGHSEGESSGHAGGLRT